MSLSVIHLSDIHIKGANDEIFKKINALKAACVSSLPHNGDVVIAISGDIAFSGNTQQYELAKNMLADITNYISEEKESHVHVVCVPGNHDCDFKKDSSVRNALVDSACHSTIDLEYYGSIAAIQHEYRDFAESIGVNCDLVLPRVEITCGGFPVLFVLVNTAWMSVLNESPGKIIMPCHLYEEISPEDYTVVFYVLHHPANWLDPDYKKNFVDYVRQNADMVLVGHEHMRDRYEKTGDSFSVYCNHGKELQDSKSGDSAFSVINFDSSFQNYDIIDYIWTGEKYDRSTSHTTRQYHKNVAAREKACFPNEIILNYANDIGLVLKHFAKENIVLPDLFVWPDLRMSDYCSEKGESIIIRSNTIAELNKNRLSVLIGDSSSGKTAIAKYLFLQEESQGCCCLLLRGSDFTASGESQIREIVEQKFSEQYSKDQLELFRQLPKHQRVIIVDDFDYVKNVNNRRSAVINFICGFFGKATIMLSSSIEATTFFEADAVFYEIMPLGNIKRKEIISKWYHLNENVLSEEEINDRIDSAIEKINVFLGNGNCFIPAAPVFVLSALQNIDALHKTYSGSKYGYLYESLIIRSLSNISSNYANAGNFDIDVGVLSTLAFNMLQERTTFFSVEQLEAVITQINTAKILRISTTEFLQRMIAGRIIQNDASCGESFCFLYPYIFYFFCGRYIAYHFAEPAVQKEVEYMSARLYNETYGNIIIFVCHFANNSDVIDNVLLNAYDTLKNYDTFDFTKENPIFEEIKDAVDALIPKRIAASDAEISTNKDARLARMDDIGINDGEVATSDDLFFDDVSDGEKDLAAVVAAFKIIDVLGEILQNYPTDIDGPKKLEIIDELHKLGMRSVQAIINTMGYLENDLLEYMFERVSKENPNISKDMIARATRQLINLLVSGVARGMIHQVATSLNSKHLLPAASKVFEGDSSISSKLVLLDLKLNCLNHCDFSEIQRLKKELSSRNEQYASRIVDSIVGYYLNYTRCDHALRAKLCALCGLSQQKALIAAQQNAQQ